jgi:hypothetical protein
LRAAEGWKRLGQKLIGSFAEEGEKQKQKYGWPITRCLVDEMLAKSVEQQ